jgi:hypothetical protein
MLDTPSVKSIDHRAIGERIAGKLSASPNAIGAQLLEKTVQMRSLNPIGRRSPKLHAPQIIVGLARKGAPRFDRKFVYCHHPIPYRKSIVLLQ